MPTVETLCRTFGPLGRRKLLLLLICLFSFRIIYTSETKVVGLTIHCDRFLCVFTIRNQNLNMRKEKGLCEATRNSAFCKRVLVLSALHAGFSVGYTFTSLNPLVPVIEEIYNATFQKRYGESISRGQWTTLLSLTMSMLVAGGFVGSLLVKTFLNIFTRKHALMFWSSIHIAGAIIIAAGVGAGRSYEAFIIGRVIMGFAIGIGQNTAPVVIAEYSTRSEQSFYQSIVGVGISIGSVVGVTIAHPMVLGTINRWPGVIILNCVFTVAYILLSPWIPESPYTLLRQNKREKAIRILKKLRNGKQESILAEIRSMEEEQFGFQSGDEIEEGNQLPKINFVGILDILKTHQYRHQLLIVAMVYWGAIAIGLNHVLFFSDQIFIKGGIPADIVTYVTIGVFTVEGIVAAVGTKLITIVGSRKLLLGTTSLAVVSHVFTVAGLATRHLSPGAGYMSVVGIMLFLVSFAAGPNIVTYALAGELTIEPTRQTILNYCGAVMWFTGWLTGFIAAYLDEGLGPYAFLVWLACSITFLVLTYFFVPETKGKTTEEIQKELS